VDKAKRAIDSAKELWLPLYHDHSKGIHIKVLKHAIYLISVKFLTNNGQVNNAIASKTLCNNYIFTAKLACELISAY